VEVSHIQAKAAALSSTARLGSLQRGLSYPQKNPDPNCGGGSPWHGVAELWPVPGPRRGSPHCAPGVNALNGISVAKGRKAVGKPACAVFLSSAVAAERRRSAGNRVKKVKSNCWASLILNYVFVNLHNSLSAAVLSFNAQSGNCERGWGGRGEGWRSTEGEKHGKLRLNQRRATNSMK